jgi:hypothetical protein
MGWEDTITKDTESEAPANGWEATITKDAPKVSELESGVRGLAQGASLGYSDELTGGIEALWDKAINGDKTALVELYRKNRDESRANNKIAQEANPGVYGTGQVAGAIGTGIATGGSLPALAGVGAAQGLGNSEADLTQGDVGGAVRDTAIGTGIGVVTAGAGKALGALGSKVMPKVTNVLEDVATAPMGQSGSQMGNVAGAINKVGKVGSYLDDVQDKVVSSMVPEGMKKGVSSPLANMVESGLALGPVGVKIQAGIQGAKFAPQIAQKTAQLTLEQIIPKMGRFSQVLSDAAQRGASSLAASDYVLQQQDPEYRELKRKAQE